MGQSMTKKLGRLSSNKLPMFLPCGQLGDKATQAEAKR
jgi:hypothetical protein